MNVGKHKGRYWPKNAQHCTLYILRCTIYIVHCTLYIVSTTQADWKSCRAGEKLHSDLSVDKSRLSVDTQRTVDKSRLVEVN